MRELADLFLNAWGSGTWTDVSDANHPHEAGILRLKISKAKKELGWSPSWTFETMIQRTVSWYRNVLCEGADARKSCIKDIKTYGQ